MKRKRRKIVYEALIRYRNYSTKTIDEANKDIYKLRYKKGTVCTDD